MTTTVGKIRTILGDREGVSGSIYGHEHLILDSPLIEARFPHIHLWDLDAAIREVNDCARAGAGLMVDAMPISAGRDILRLAALSQATGVDVVATTGLHHDRYYGPLHWTNRVTVEELADLFVADLIEGVDEFDYTSPVVRRTKHRAGLVKVATSGEIPDARDLRNIEAVAQASRRTGAPVLTHCEGGYGGAAQIDYLVAAGVPARAIILSHVDKTENLSYLRDLAETGAVLELDQSLRQHDRGVSSVTVRAVQALMEAGLANQIIVGTDGARRNLWKSLDGSPGLVWLAEGLPADLRAVGVSPDVIQLVMHDNAERVLRWRTVEES